MLKSGVTTTYRCGSVVSSDQLTIPEPSYYVLGNPKYGTEQAISLHTPDGRLVCKFKSGGVLEIGADFRDDPDKAAQEFWAAVERMTAMVGRKISG